MVLKINTNTVLHHLSTRTDAILFISKISSGLLVEWISPESSEPHLFIEENFVKSSGVVGLIQISILHHSFWQWLIYSIRIKMRDSEIEKCISSLSYLPQVSQMFFWQLWRVQPRWIRLPNYLMLPILVGQRNERVWWQPGLRQPCQIISKC